MTYLSLFSGIGNCSNSIKLLMSKFDELPDTGMLGDAEFRISSKEVAKATGKTHAHVLRDIRNLLKSGVEESNFGFSFSIKKLHNGTEREYTVCMLTKKGVLLLTSGYSAKLREAVINRWEELEKQRIAEEKDPSLSVSKAVVTWKKQGKNEQWISTRTQGIVTRHYFTDTLQNHGVTGTGYAMCTNAIYKPTLGGTNKEVKEKKNLPVKANLRDYLDNVELAAVTLSEALATERIEKHNAEGNSQCIRHSSIAAMNVSKALKATRE